MSRKGSIKKRSIAPDHVYSSEDLARFINIMMLDGKKSKSMGVVYGALEYIKMKNNQDPLEVFKKAIANIAPEIEVRSRRVGGSTYQIPSAVGEFRARSLAFRWLKESARKRNEKTMKLRLYMELLDAYAGRGGAVKKREEKYKTAEANRAFAHFRV